MTDPFQNLAHADQAVIDTFLVTLEERAADPAMAAIIDGYLDEIDWPSIGCAIEVGSGTGPICRRIAARMPGGEVVGIEPTPQMVARARELARDLPNLRFEETGGLALPFDEGSLDLVVMHTLLTHVEDPAAFLAEAHRVLRPGGRLVVCDVDFSKATLSGGAIDPLATIGDAFVGHFVTDPHLVPRLGRLIEGAGLSRTSMRVETRLVTDTAQMKVWVTMGGRALVERGLIGAALVDALEVEYDRRMAAGTLHGFQPFAIVWAAKPGG
ncbi:MAG: methyltransferase domain-containing protein [Pseudomonadota bacterium]